MALEQPKFHASAWKQFYEVLWFYGAEEVINQGNLKDVGRYVREAVNSKERLSVGPRCYLLTFLPSALMGVCVSARSIETKGFQSISHRTLVLTPRQAWDGCLGLKLAKDKVISFGPAAFQSLHCNEL